MLLGTKRAEHPVSLVGCLPPSPITLGTARLGWQEVSRHSHHAHRSVPGHWGPDLVQGTACSELHRSLAYPSLEGSAACYLPAP